MQLMDKYQGMNFDSCSELNCDLVVIDNNTNELVFVSALAYESYIKQTLKTIKTNKNRVSVYFNRRYYSAKKDYKVLTKKVKSSSYTHMILHAPDIYTINGANEAFTNYIFIKNENDLEQEVYKRLVKYSSVPILEEWIPYVVNKMKEQFVLTQLEVHRYLPESNSIENFLAYKLSCNRNTMINIISEGLQQGILHIEGTNNASELLGECNGIDSYLRLFGEGLAKKIQESFRPKFIPGEDSYDIYTNNVDDYVHYKSNVEIYEAQKSAIQAVTNQLKNNSIAMIVAEMGAGKSLMALSSCYAHHANKNKGFNSLIMCPSHLLNNWKNEIEKFAPNGKAYIVHDLQELLDLKDKLYDPYKIENSFVILSKEIAKIGYGNRPAALTKKVGTYINERGQRIKATNVFVCPECGQVLTKVINVPVPNTRRKVKKIVPLELLDFLKPNQYNQTCTNKIKVWDNKNEQYEEKQCNAKLWTALNRDDENTPWIKLGANGWIMKQHIQPITNMLLAKEKLSTKESNLVNSLVEQYNSIQETGKSIVHFKGTKKYPIAKYIKERMNDVFDYLIVDEL